MTLKELGKKIKALADEFGDDLPVFIFVDGRVGKRRFDLKISECGSGIVSSAEEIAITPTGSELIALFSDGVKEYSEK